MPVGKRVVTWSRGLVTWVKRVARGSAPAAGGQIHRQLTACKGVQRPPLSGNGVHGARQRKQATWHAKTGMDAEEVGACQFPCSDKTCYRDVPSATIVRTSDTLAYPGRRRARGW